MKRVDLDCSGDDKRIIKLADMQAFEMDNGDFMCIHTPTEEMAMDKRLDFAVSWCIESAFWHVHNA